MRELTEMDLVKLRDAIGNDDMTEACKGAQAVIEEIYHDELTAGRNIQDYWNEANSGAAGLRQI